MRIDELVDYVQQESRVFYDFAQKLITLLSQALEKAIDRHYENKKNAQKGEPSKDMVKGGEKKEPPQKVPQEKQNRQLVKSRNDNNKKSQPVIKGDREHIVHVATKQEVSYTYVKKAGKDFDLDSIMSVKKMTYVSIYSAEYKNRRKINTTENNRNYSHRNERSHAMHRKMA